MGHQDNVRGEQGKGSSATRVGSMFNMVQAAAQVGVWEYNLPAKTLWFSDVLFHLCGYEPGAFEPTVERFLTIFYREDRYEIADCLYRAMEEGVFRPLEKRIVRQDGQIRLVLIQADVYQDTEQKSSRIVGTFQDITRLRGLESSLQENSQTLTRLRENIEKLTAAETALRQNEARLKQAQYLAGMGIWEWDIATDVTTWSDEMFPIYGILPESFTGKGADYFDFTHPDDLQTQISNINAAFEQAAESDGGELVASNPQEFRIVRPDGSICFVRGDAVAITDETGKPVRMLGILMDITGQKQNEMALVQLLEAEQKAHKRVEALAQELSILHRISQLVLMTGSFDDALEEIMVEISQATDYPNMTFEVYDPLRKIMVIRSVIEDGRSVPVRLTAVPLAESISGKVIRSGNPLVVKDSPNEVEDVSPGLTYQDTKAFIFMPLTNQDRTYGAITFSGSERQEPQPYMMEWMKSLANYLASLVERQQVEEALRQAQKLESLGVMASGVAHDFNNLLTGIMAQTSLAMHRIEKKQSPMANLRKVMNTAEQAAVVTKQLLDYTGQGVRQEERLDLSDLIQKTLPLLELTISGSITIETSLVSEAFITADKGQIQQVILNLVLNAAEAYEGRPGTIRVLTWRQPLALPGARPGPTTIKTGNYICMVVEDKGVGISEETLPRIFDPFYTTKFTGRGLGLAAALGVIQRHQGNIEVFSQPGKGTTLQVLLPEYDEEGDTAETADQPEESAVTIQYTAGFDQGENPLVLVIEDEEPLRSGYTDILEIYGCRTVAAENGEEGLALFHKHGSEIAVILLDMTMPVMSGPETLKAIRDIDKNVPVLLLSGYSRSQLEQMVTMEERLDFLQKPFRVETLWDKTRQVMAMAG